MTFPGARSRPAPSRAYLEIVVVAPETARDTVVAALHASGSTGAWIADRGEIRGYYPAAVGDAARGFAAAWRELTGGEDPPAVAVRPVPDEDWIAKWRETAGPTSVTERLWVAPPGAPPPPGGWPANALVLRILPGLGFGTGTHPTTRALLRWLAADPDFDAALDVGTGSGILAIAAARLGASRAVAIDLDPLALENAAENVRSNAVEGRVALVRGSIDSIAGAARFDRVLANLDGPTLAAILPDVAARCASRGRVGLAGLLATEREATLQRARAAGLTLVDEATEADEAAGDLWWSGWTRRSA